MLIETLTAAAPRRTDQSALLLVAPCDDPTDDAVLLMREAARLAEEAGLQVELRPWSLREGGRRFLMLTVRADRAPLEA
ncbi:hypothetical protein [Brevundimonas sp.]|jgi:hypothetical protein|uniref:hypothetical protein n=1 Tax=Brevundimonas sp. TaxID=1871086 RepID=UPI00180B365B|nr:hypothetical protein [Brevundimonas sp.]MBA4808895.1 hypothetical protein [Brevundimonas sp.]